MFLCDPSSEKKKDSLDLSRRYFIFRMIGILLSLILIIRLYYLQIVKGEYYTKLANRNRMTEVPLPPKRGTIFDSQGKMLAMDEIRYRVVFYPLLYPRGEDTDIFLYLLSELLSKKKEDLRALMFAESDKQPIVLADGLTLPEVDVLSMKLYKLPAITLEYDLVRVYPAGQTAAHLLGYVSYDEELAHGVKRITGKSGIEKSYNDTLSGQFGFAMIETDARGRKLREIEYHAPQSGHNIQISLDIEAQKKAFEGLSAYRAGSVILVSVPEGKILAMASYPSFNTEAFGDSEEWKAMRRNTDRPFVNRSISGVYAPASVFKPIVALAGLKAGVSSSEKIFCSGEMTLGNHTFRCWKHTGHGDLDMVGGLRESCDVYFYQLAQRIGFEKIEAMARSAGYGSVIDLPLHGVASGFLPSDVLHHKKIHWNGGDTLVLGIGQGYIGASPIQLVLMALRIASGRSCNLMLDTMAHGSDKFFAPEADLKVVREGMYQVLNHTSGTAYRRSLGLKHQFAGKTGTSQQVSLSVVKDFKKDAIPWTYRDHSLFVGFGPYQNPQVACAVVLEHAGGGSSHAAPLGLSLMDDYLTMIQERNA